MQMQCNAMQCGAETELPPRTDLSRFRMARDVREPQALRHARRLGRNKHTHTRAHPVEPSDLQASASEGGCECEGFLFFGCLARGRIHGLQTGMLAVVVRYLEG